MADRSISISLEANVSGFTSGLRTAQQATTDFADRTAAFARDNEQNLDRVGKASMVLGGSLLAGVALAVKSFMEFDSAMSEVSASTHETSANMDLLREAAINAGADTAFSAKEAAQGIDELAKAGVSTQDILSGGLTGALSLASAGALGVADAAEISATALTQFKLAGKDIPHIADLLAAGAGKAQGSVEDIGNALKQSGLVAAQFGMSIEDTTGTLAAFASAGLIGSDAGTSLKTMLLKLASPSKEAAGMMEELGIAAYDSGGKFVGVANLAGQLKDKLADSTDGTQKMTQATRDNTLATIFGTDAIRGANVLYEQGAEGIQKMVAAVNDSGYAAETARIKTDNLAGDIERLGGSFDSVLIKGGGGVATSLRGMVQGAEDFVDAIGKIPGPVLNASVGIAGIAGGALLLGGGLLTVLPKIMEFRTSMAALATAAPRAATGISRVAKAAGVAVIALVALQVAAAVFTEKDTKSAEDYGQALLKIGKAGQVVGTSGLDSVFQGFDKFAGNDIVGNVDSLAGAVKRLTSQNFDDVGNKFFEPFTNLLGLPKGEIGQLEDRLRGLGEAMGGLVKNGGAEQAAKGFQELTKEFEKNGKGAQEALDSVPGYKDALLGLANSAHVVLKPQELLALAMGNVPDSMKKAADSVETYVTKVGNVTPITEAMAKSLEEVGISAQGAVTDIDAFTKSLFNAGILSLSASGAAIAYQAAIDAVTDSIVENGKSLDIHEPKGRANQSAYDGLAKSAMDAATATATQTLATDGSKAAQDQLQTSLGQSYKDLITAAGQFDITGDAADTMARKALGIPKNVNIDAWIADHASTTLDGIKGKADGLDGRRVSIGIYTTEYFDSVDRRSAMPDLNGAASGSGRPGMATGGRVYGPGTSTSDSVPTMLSRDEFVIKASAAKALGYGYLDKLNGGDTQPLKAGTQFAPAAAPARQMVSVGASDNSGPTQMTGTLVMDSGEVLGVFHGVAVAAAKGVVSDADSQSQRMRRGRS